MKKTHKKFELQLITLLTKICEQSKQNIRGFSWLTHTVNLSDINNTLRIICIFDNNLQLTQAKEDRQLDTLTKQLLCTVNTLNIEIKNNKNLVHFDTEENCQLSHQGNWKLRLNTKYH